MKGGVGGRGRMGWVCGEGEGGGRLARTGGGVGGGGGGRGAGGGWTTRTTGKEDHNYLAEISPSQNRTPFFIILSIL